MAGNTAIKARFKRNKAGYKVYIFGRKYPRQYGQWYRLDKWAAFRAAITDMATTIPRITWGNKTRGL